MTQGDDATGALRFAADFSWALRADGCRVTFTAAEARLLAHLVAHPGITLSRERLLDAVSAPGSDQRDRIIDSRIVRLRRKLGARGRGQGPIQTRYGAGYVWVGAGPAAEPGPAADIVLGPVHGLEALGTRRGPVRRRLEALAPRFAAQFGGTRSVAAALAADPGGAPRAERYRTRVILDAGAAAVEGIFETQEVTGGRVISVARHRLAGAEAPPPGDLARQVVATLWRDLALLPERPAPLPVMMNNASIELGAAADGTATSREMLAVLLARCPEDPALRLMAAIALHSQYVMGGMRHLADGTAAFEADLAEIRARLSGLWTEVTEDPVLAMAAAKLWHFVAPEHRGAALAMAEAAHRESRSFAGSLATLAQLRAFEGAPESAQELLARGRELTPPGSSFEAYFLVLACQCQAVSGDAAGLRESLARLYAERPENRPFFDLVFGDPAAPSEAARGMLARLERPGAHGLLRHLYYLTARLYRERHHHDAILRPALWLVTDRFGAAGVPAELRGVAEAVLAA